MYGLRAVVFSLLYLCTVTASADVRPAYLDYGENPLTKTLYYPRAAPKDGDHSVAVAFQVDATKKGRLKRISFRSYTRDRQAFFIATEKALKKARILPALVDDKPSMVTLSGAVVYQQRNGKRTMSLIQNDGTEIDGHGLQYIGPQRIGGRLVFQSKMSATRLTRNASGFGATCLVNYEVDAFGKTSGIEVTHQRPPRSAYPKSVITAINLSEFIPATAEGQAISIQITEVYKNTGSGEYKILGGFQDECQEIQGQCVEIAPL